SAIPSASRVHVAKRGTKPAPSHARARSMRRRVATPVVTFGLTTAVIVACLIGFGDAHRAKQVPGQALRASADQMPLPTAVGDPTTTSVRADIAPDSILPQVV